MVAVRRYFPALVTLLAVVTFLPALRNGFVDFDDGKNFLLNPAYRGLGFEQLRWMFTTAHMGHYIPLTWVTLGLDYWLWGMDPAGYHFTSVVLHAAMAGLFYLVTHRLFVAAVGQADSWTTAAGALVAALVFAVHPLRVESVAWITERRDVLSGVLCMATLLAWLRAVEGDRASRRWYWTSVVLFACALLSKVIVVALPAVLLVLDVYPLRRLGSQRGWWNPRARAVYMETAPFFALAAGASVLAFLVVLSVLDNMATPQELGLAGRAAISAFGLAFYLWKTLLPIGLSPLYELRLPVEPTAAPYLVSAGLVLSLCVLAGALRHRARWFGAAWAVYVIMLLPVLGVFQNGPQIAADRYTYLACLPWALVVGGGATVGLRRALRSSRANEVVLALAVVSIGLIVSLQAATVTQIRAWRDAVTLWEHAVAATPSSAIAHNNLAGALVDADRADEAIEPLERAVALLDTASPKLRARIAFNLASVLQVQGDLVGAERVYRETLALNPHLALAWNNLGVILATRGDYEAALPAFRVSLVISPGNRDACDNGRRVAQILTRSLKELERCRFTAKT
jgi:tetratricopeptide (TPR) repeat protein